MVCGVGSAAEGAAIIVIWAEPEAFDACWEYAVIMIVAGVGMAAGAV